MDHVEVADVKVVGKEMMSRCGVVLSSPMASREDPGLTGALLPC